MVVFIRQLVRGPTFSPTFWIGFGEPAWVPVGLTRARYSRPSVCFGWKADFGGEVTLDQGNRRTGRYVVSVGATPAVTFLIWVQGIRAIFVPLRQRNISVVQMPHEGSFQVRREAVPV